MSLIKPLEDRVVIELDETENVTKSGIIIPTNARAKATTGTIVFKGEDACSVNIGDRVIFGSNAGTPVQIEEKNYALMRQANLMAVIG